MRNAQAADLDALAQLWFDGWQEAHAPILPVELARYRTLPGFRSRLEAALACAIGNDRAARFYEKNGWHRAGEMLYEIPTPDGIFPLEVWRYDKRVGAR